MADMITRCPKCATAFRISDSLLKSAKGVVRCGSCLNVFNASNHLEHQNKTQSTSPLASAISHTPKASTPEVHSKQIDLLYAEPLAPKIAEANLSTGSSGRSPLQRAPRNFPPYFDNNGGLFERTTTPEIPNSEDENESADDDEAWALELLKDDSETDITFKKITAPEPPVPNADALGQIDDLISASKQDPEAPVHDSLEDDLPPIDTEPPSIPAKFAGTSDTTPKMQNPNAVVKDQTSREHKISSRAKAVDLKSNVTETTAAPHMPVKVDTTATADAPIATSNNTSSDVVEQDLIEEIELKDTPQPIARTSTSNRQKALDKFNAHKSNHHGPAHISAIKAAIANIEPEPLEVAWQESSPLWRRRVLWPLLVLLGLSALAVQIAWLEFHRLNRIEPYRSVYAKACQYLDCQLPELVDRTRIQTSNLLVRSHPEVVGALMVDVILQNNADFEQTFPSLLLTFTDIKSQTVASRKLTPQEYLGGELSGMNSMPTKQPIHIGIEILDPGKDAVSYSIAIVD